MAAFTHSAVTAFILVVSVLATEAPRRISSLPPSSSSTVTLEIPTHAPVGGNGWKGPSVGGMGTVRILNNAGVGAYGWCNGYGYSGEEQVISEYGVLAPSGQDKAYFISKSSKAANAAFSLLEWNHIPSTGHLSYDFSHVDANLFKFVPPFVKEGMIVIPIDDNVPARFDTCVTLLCSAGEAHCTSAYNHDKDDLKMHTSPITTDLLMVIGPSQELIDRAQEYDMKPMPSSSLQDILVPQMAVVRKVAPRPPTMNAAQHKTLVYSVLTLVVGSATLLAPSLF